MRICADAVRAFAADKKDTWHVIALSSLQHALPRPPQPWLQKTARASEVLGPHWRQQDGAVVRCGCSGTTTMSSILPWNHQRPLCTHSARPWLPPQRHLHRLRSSPPSPNNHKTVKHRLCFRQRIFFHQPSRHTPAPTLYWPPSRDHRLSPLQPSQL